VNDFQWSTKEIKKIIKHCNKISVVKMNLHCLFVGAFLINKKKYTNLVIWIKIDPQYQFVTRGKSIG
jgi:hypothetical protein